VIIFSGCSGIVSENKIFVKNGVADYRSTDLNISENGESLDGKWNFFWKKFLSSDEIISGSVKSEAFINVPGKWNNYIADDEKIGAVGYGTYYCRVYLKNGTGQDIAFQFSEIGTAYRFYVNGDLVSTRGFVSENSKDSKPSTVPNFIVYHRNSDILDIVIHVSNYSYRKGGLWHSIRIGCADKMLSKNNKEILIEAVLICIIFVMGLYHLVYYILSRRDKAALFFSLSCIAIAVRQSVIGHKFLLYIFPETPWEIYLRLEYLSLAIVIPLMSYYFYLIFREIFSRYYHYLLVFIFIIFFGIIIFTPSVVYTNSILFYEANVAIFVFYCVFILGKAILQGNRDVKYIFWPGLFFGITVINDILYVNKLVNTADLFSVGMLVFIFSQAVLLAKRFNYALEKAEILTRELSEKNLHLLYLNNELSKMKENLELKVQERTVNLKNALDKAEVANRSKNYFLANISHEFRTPLNIIMGFAQIIRLDLRDMEISKMLANIIDSGKHLINLVNEILDFSRIEDGKAGMNIEVIDITALIKNISESVIPLVNEKKLNWKIDILNEHLFIKGDQGRVKQIFFNLLSNAVKFTDSGKSIGLKMSVNLNNVVITVWDEGIGIAPNDSAKIFEPFEQISDLERGKPDGTGLGLSIVKKLVSFNGGSIDVESELGRGSKFSISFPLLENQPEKNTVSEVVTYEKPISNNKYSNVKLLVVDDNDMNISLMMKFFSVMGIDADYAVNGIEGYNKLLEGSYDLVLLDIQMPGMDGITLVNEIRDKKQVIPPIIAVTGLASDAEKKKILSSGFSGYLAKPFSFDELMLIIDSNI